MTKIIQDVNIGTNLKKIRNSKEWTQEQVCAKLTVIGRPMIQSTYAQIETGARNIFVSDLIALKSIFNVEFDDIFHGLVPINKYEMEESK